MQNLVQNSPVVITGASSGIGAATKAILWVVTRPPHVCVDEMLIKPTDQAAMHKTHRRSS